MLGTHLRLVPGLGNGRVQLVDAEQLRGVGGGKLRVHLQQWLAQVSGGQDQARLGVGDDRQQAFLVMAARRLRRIGRHRDDTGIQATEERRDIVGAAGKQQHRAIAQLRMGLQGRGDAPRAQVEIAIAEDHAFAIVLGEEAQRQALGLLDGAATQGLDQGGGKFEGVHHVFPA